jgi:hypothetical protein
VALGANDVKPELGGAARADTASGQHEEMSLQQAGHRADMSSMWHGAQKAASLHALDTVAVPGIVWLFLLLCLASRPVQAQVANDNFASARPLDGCRGVVTVFTVGATREPDEPLIAGKNSGGASVWFRWTAPTNGSFRFDTESSEFDTLLAIYTNNTFTTLSLLGSNDNIDRNNVQSQVTINAVAGRTYQVTVDGKAAAAGYLVLTWAPAGASLSPVPTNDNFAAACEIAGSTGQLSVSSVNATKEAGEPYHAGVPDGKTVWFRWQAPVSGFVCFDAAASDFDTVMAAYQGAAVANLTKLASNNDIGNFIRQSRLILRVVAGQVCHIAVGGVQMSSGVAREGTVALAWRLDPAAGSNDLFANAQALSGPHGVAFGLNSEASLETGEPVRADNIGGRSIWYRWTAPVTGQVIFDSAGSQFDSPFFPYLLLTVYAGNTLSSLARVADNFDPVSGGYVDSVSFIAQAGATYHISVDGYYDPMFCHCVAQGAVALNWTQPGVVLLGGPRRGPSQTIEMDLSAPTGRDCAVLVSTNLTRWDLWTNFTSAEFLTTLRAESQPPTAPRRFFRAALRP